MLILIIIVVAVVIIAGVSLVHVYNKLVALRECVRNAFAPIDVQLERRHDLIPNLVETVRRYLRHERASPGTTPMTSTSTETPSPPS